MYGEVTIKFSEPLLVPTDAYEIINEDTLQIRVIPLEEPMTPMLNFKWTLSKFESDSAVLQIDFENPIYVSKSPRGRDDISLQVLEPNLFISEKSLRSIEKEEIVEANIPP